MKLFSSIYKGIATPTFRNLIGTSRIFSREITTQSKRFFFTSTLLHSAIHPISVVSKEAEAVSLLTHYHLALVRLNEHLIHHYTIGLNLYKNKKYLDSIMHFDKVINTLSGENTENLTERQKIILAMSHTYKASFLRNGSSEEESAAVGHLDIALMLLPDLQMAKDLKNSIQCDHVVSGPSALVT